MTTFLWLLKREFWEHRGGFFWAPLVAVGIFLTLTLMGLILGEITMVNAGIEINNLDLEQFTGVIPPEQLEQLGMAINLSLFTSAWLIGVVLFFVLFFYLLGALYDERKERSILFWKSMPVSDTETVVSKVVSATIVAPIISVVATWVLMLGFLLLLSLFIGFHGVNPIRVLWGPADPMLIALKLLFTVPISALWALPCVGWLLLCSAYARKAPFLWATAIPVGAGTLVSWFSLFGSLTDANAWFWSDVVFRVLFSVAPASWLDMGQLEALNQPAASPALVMEYFSFSNMGSTLLRPGMWLGIIAGLLMIAGAIYLRRWRDES